MLNTFDLHQLRKMLYMEYKQYKDGLISEKQYLALIKPIDQAIDKLEMSTLPDNPVLKGSSSQLSR